MCINTFFEEKMIFVAITGSIGCGKTTVSNLLRKLGYLVYDADKWVRVLYFKKDFLKEIQKYFPQVFKNDVFDKKLLRSIVFQDPQQLKILENLIHPFLTQRLRQILRYQRNDGIVFFEAPLLFELGWDKFFDYVVVADVAYDIQKERVMKRDKISEEEFVRINALQMPRCDKICRADMVIDTGVGLDKLRRNIVQMLGVF